MGRISGPDLSSNALSSDDWPQTYRAMKVKFRLRVGRRYVADTPTILLVAQKPDQGPGTPST